MFTARGNFPVLKLIQNGTSYHNPTPLKKRCSSTYTFFFFSHYKTHEPHVNSSLTDSRMNSHAASVITNTDPNAEGFLCIWHLRWTAWTSRPVSVTRRVLENYPKCKLPHMETKLKTPKSPLHCHSRLNTEARNTQSDPTEAERGRARERKRGSETKVERARARERERQGARGKEEARGEGKRRAVRNARLTSISAFSPRRAPHFPFHG